MMNMRYLAIFAMAILFSGVFAITGATVTSVENLARWDATAAGPIVTEGGNISAVNLSSSSLTDRWAAFFGNVTGTIYLTDRLGGSSNKYVYSWTASDASGGEVCVSTNQAFNFASANATTREDVDRVWFPGESAADNATGTLTNNKDACNLTFYVASVTDTAGVETGDNNADDTFITCAINQNATAAKGDFAFCTFINSTGKNYLDNPADYELMVPTNSSIGATETYYFFVEFN